MTALTMKDFCTAYGWNENEVTMNIFGNFIHKPSNTELGNIKDLKIDIENRLNKKTKEEKKAERTAMLNDLVPTAVEILKQRLPEAKVFKNRTMPNVDLGGIRFYIIIGNTIDTQLAVRFMHKEMSASQVIRYIGNNYQVRNPVNSADNNVLVGGNMGIDEVANMIEYVVDLIGEK